MICYNDKHLLEQLVLQLQVNGKQYSISDPVMQSSCGTVPVKLFEYKDKPESATKRVIVVSHSLQQDRKACIKIKITTATKLLTQTIEKSKN